MAFVAGAEGLTIGNATKAGAALREFHKNEGYCHECVTGMWWLISLAKWMKCVQLDLEAKSVVIREASKPLRWHRA